jgi:mevalonate kinase
MRLPARGRAGGKIILLGEHVVVYGRPAIAAGLPIGLDAVVEDGEGPSLRSDDPSSADDPRCAQLVAAAAELAGLDPSRVVVRVRSELPAGRGLGSSAALSVATLRACAIAGGRTLTRDEELAAGRRLEAIFHGTPSGIDPAAAALGACFRFVRGDPPTVTPLAVARPLPLVVAFPSEARSTGAAVGGVRQRWEADRARHEALFDDVATVVERGADAMARGDLAALGRAFDDNQSLLATLGVSSPSTEALVGAARMAGALGAKLTGGGAGGAVIALAERPEAVASMLRRDGVQTLIARVGSGTEESS